MGEVFKEVDLNEVLETNPAAFEKLKSIYSVFAHYDKLPAILKELKHISKEQIPEEFSDGKVILAEDINGESLLLINPELISIMGIKYVKYSDIWNKITWNEGEKFQIALSKIAKSDKLKEKILALKGKTKIQIIKEKSKGAYRTSLQVGGQMAKGAAKAGKKAKPFVTKAGRFAVGAIVALDPDKNYYSKDE